MALLAVFAECLPEQFLACQSINMLDGVTQMPAPAFESLKVSSRPAPALNRLGGEVVLLAL